MAFADFKAVARAALAQSETLVPAWLPGGKQHGPEYVSVNPVRSDAAAGSFSINLSTGAWSDFATGDAGGDLISLYAYLQNIRNGEARDELAKQLGVAAPAARAKTDNAKHVSPVPDSAPPPPEKHRDLGAPNTHWCYRDPDGQVLGYRYRFDTATGKEFRPLSLWMNQDNGSLFWRFKEAPGQRPLYGLHRLYARPDAPVVITEGEKAADAAARLLPNFVTTTSPDGAKAPQKADFSHLKGRQVTIWPDADQPGKGYAQAVTAILKALGVEAKTAPILEGVEVGYDAADAEADGWTPQQAMDYLATAEVLATKAGDAWQKRPEEEPDAVSAGSMQGAINRQALWVIEPGRLPEAMDYAEKVLIRNQAGIYQRSGKLVRIEAQKEATTRRIKRSKGALIITAVDRDWLHNQLDRHVAWMKWNAKKKKDVDTDVHHAISPRLLANSGEWLFENLSGIITAPTIRPDGSLLQQPGYDPETGLFFDPQGETFLPIPDAPTQTEGRAALDLLIREVLSSQCESDPDQTGFAFATPAARSAALSAILTPLVRNSLGTAPLHLISATRPGSGKSLLADACALIATGRRATILELGDDPAEQDKRILTVLLAGDAVINLDNLEAPIGGAAIAKALTAESYSGRLLGANKQATAPTSTAFWLATGNNAKTLTDDANRRIVLCKLEPQVEAPQDREYARDLTEWIPANRPALVAAGLTAIRAYIAAGKPKQPYPRLGSFEDWSNLIRSTLTWLGEADPRGDSMDLVEADPTRVKLRALLSAWHSAFGSVPTTAKEAVARANSVLRDETGNEAPHDPILREVLQDHFTDNRRGGISTRYLGEFLSKFKGRIESGARFEQCESYRNTATWRIFIVDKTRFEAGLCGLGGLGGSANPAEMKNDLSPKPKTNPEYGLGGLHPNTPREVFSCKTPLSSNAEKSESAFFVSAGLSDPPNPPNPHKAENSFSVEAGLADSQDSQDSHALKQNQQLNAPADFAADEGEF